MSLFRIYIRGVENIPAVARRQAEIRATEDEIDCELCFVNIS